MDAICSKKCHRRLNLVLAVWMTTGLVLGQSTGPATNDKSAIRVLLLDNKDLLQGAVTADAESFHVRPSGGGVMTIPRYRVLYLGQAKKDAYQFMSRRVQELDPAGRVELIEWCLGQRLLSEAEDEWKRLKAASPQHPELERLWVRLDFLSEPTRRDLPAVGTAKLPAVTVARKLPPKISEESTRAFARQLQPLLLNSCGSVGCHGRGGVTQRMPLTRPPRGMNMNQRLMHRNLSAVLKEVNFVNPRQSPLYVAATTAHANQAAVFRPESAYAETLATWISGVTGKPIRKDPTPEPKPSDKVTEEVANKPASPSETPKALDLTPAKADSDPLDPEIFNRQYGRKG